MATPLPGPPVSSSNEGLVGAREDFLRMVMAPGLGQLDDDVLHSFLVPAPSGSVPSLSGCLPDDPAQLAGSHGYHMAPTCHGMPAHGPASTAHLPMPDPHTTAVSRAAMPENVGWGYLDLFQGDAMSLGQYGSCLPAVPVLAMGGPPAVPVGGGAWDAPASPSVGSVKLGSPEQSQTGALGEHAGSGGSAGAPAPDPDLFHKEKQRLAQKRFRERQKDKMRNTQKQVEELSEKMNALMSEKAALESRNRVLEQVVKLNIDHEKKLHCHKEIMSREQELLLEELAAFRGRVEGVPAAPLSEAKDWTMSAWLDSIFPRYMQRLKVLLTESKGSSSESSLAAAELQALVATRRVQEGRRALFSCFYPAVYSWNREEMEGGATPPASSHWAAVLEGLRLTREQEQKVLEARAALLEALRAVAGQRAHILSGLALELLGSSREQWHTCPGVQRLLRSLGQERAAVHTFLFSLCDEILTPKQEAYLDTHAYPWCPDLWAVVGCLAAKLKGLASMETGEVKGLEVGGRALAPLMPLNTAFQLLTSPLLARGLGLRLKCGILMDPYLTVVPASAFPTASVAQLGGMSIYDVHCGRYRSTQFQEWLRTNLPDHSRLTANIPH